jgi:acetyl esterase/lipase
MEADPLGRGRFDQYKQDPYPLEFPAVRTDDFRVPAGDGTVGVREYVPLAWLVEGAPTLVWVHGGGFSGGDIDMNEGHMVAAELAARTPARVFSVDYRLALDGVRFPAPLDDVSAVVDWAFRDANAGSRLAVGGASAGAALAAGAVVRAVADGGAVPDGLLLAYPFVHFPVPALSFELAEQMNELPGMLRFSAGVNEWMTENYLGRTNQIPARPSPEWEVWKVCRPPLWSLASMTTCVRPANYSFANCGRQEWKRRPTWPLEWSTATWTALRLSRRSTGPSPGWPTSSVTAER